MVAALVLPSLGCASGNGDRDAELPTGTTEVSAVSVVSAEPAGVWGVGRATMVRQTAGGDRVVATTSGLFVLEDGAARPRRIAAFAGPTRATAMSVIGDSSLAVAFDSPAVVVYDIQTGNETGRLELSVGQQVLALHSHVDLGEGEHGGVVVETSTGPLFWGGEDSASTIAIGDAPTGRGDVLAGGKYVAPVSGTHEILVAGASTVDRIPVPIAADEVVVDARSTPVGDVVAVTVVAAAMRSNPFDREERVVLLDAATWAPLGSVETGAALAPETWSVTDSAVVVGQGGTVSAWSFDGTPLFASSARDRDLGDLQTHRRG